VALARNADLLIHDAQYSAEEFPALAYLGHSCPEYAISLAEQAGARRVCLFHHAPRRTDDTLDELASRFLNCAVPVTVAADGLTITLGRQVRGVT
jgi:ribonuclease BN (tRNA processing enzyme)